ncbi:hypothetical protein M885DRAFT_561643 [Pelagophyceae sp. CCMP2097]|nr:hypothetical protein M885DRAFT_561643 [Pelagophyceae sp. CCMP2097]
MAGGNAAAASQQRKLAVKRKDRDAARKYLTDRRSLDLESEADLKASSDADTSPRRQSDATHERPRVPVRKKHQWALRLTPSAKQLVDEMLADEAVAMRAAEEAAAAEAAKEPRTGAGSAAPESRAFAVFVEARDGGLAGKSLALRRNLVLLQEGRAALDALCADLFPANSPLRRLEETAVEAMDAEAHADDDLRQRNAGGAAVEDVDALYACADVAAGPFLKTVDRVLREAGIAATFAAAVPKPRSRAQDKAESECPGTSPAASCVFDVVRGSVVCGTAAAMLRVQDAFSRDAGVDVVRAKNRVAEPCWTGYRDVLLLLSLLNFDARRLTSLEALTAEFASDGLVCSRRYTDATLFDELLKSLRELALCEKLQRRLVDAAEADGAEHAAAVFDLAELMFLQARYAEAKPLYRAALAMNERLFGATHDAVAPALSRLVSALEKQRLFGAAVEPSRRALEIRVRQLGADHVDVADMMVTRANLFYGQGLFDKAEPLYRRALGNLVAERLGRGHPNVATLTNNMAAVYAAQGRCDEAQPLYLRAMAVYAKTVGTAHPLFETALENCASMLRRAGALDEAMPLYRIALRIKEHRHAECAAAMSALAAMLRVQGKLAESEALFRRVWEIRVAAAGRRSLPAATALSNLGNCLKHRGQHAAALDCYADALAIREHEASKISLDVARTLVGQADVFSRQRRFGEAAGVLRRALAVHEELVGGDHAELARPLRVHANALLNDGPGGDEPAALRKRERALADTPTDSALCAIS